MEDLDKIQQQLEEQQVNLEGVTLLFLDLSSTCTGYSIAHCNFKNKTAEFVNAGAIWLNQNWSDQEKYYYLYSTVCNYFNIVGKVDFLLAEQYMFNIKQRSGSLIGPEIHGVIKLSCQEIGIKYMAVPVQSWRAMLGIKPTITEKIDKEGKTRKIREYKEPTKQKVLEFVKVPETIESNITKQTRATPSDLYDSIALGLGSLKKLGFKHFSFKNIKFQESIEM